MKDKGEEEEMWDIILQEIEVKNDGEIDFEEFKAMMMSLVENKGRKFTCALP